MHDRHEIIDLRIKNKWTRPKVLAGHPVLPGMSDSRESQNREAAAAAYSRRAAHTAMPQEASAVPPGLSTVHISPQAERVNEKLWHIEVAIGGQVLKLKANGGRYGKPKEKRAEIKGFTRASRRRLLEFVASIDQVSMMDQQKVVTMITLTYPSEFVDPRTAKKHLDTWLKRFSRSWPDAALIWKLEPQKRGAPHFHLLVFGDQEIQRAKVWVSDSWYEVVGSGDEKHLRAGTKVEKVRSWNGVMSYASKYVGKLQELPADWTNPGRFWGIHNREAVPIDIDRERVTSEAAVILRRTVRRMQHARNRSRGQFKKFRHYGGGFLAFIRFDQGLRLISQAKREARQKRGEQDWTWPHLRLDERISQRGALTRCVSLCTIGSPLITQESS